MSKVDELAKVLLVKFQREVPNVGAGKASNASTEKIRKGLESFYTLARETRKENRLWAISWARVSLKLKQALLEAGYPPDFVSKVILSMILNAAKRN